VWLATLVAARLLRRTSTGPSTTTAAAALAAVAAIAVSLGLALMVPAHSALFGAPLHHHGQPVPLVVHMAHDGLIAFAANLAIALGLAFVLRRNVRAEADAPARRPVRAAPAISRRQMVMAAWVPVLMSVGAIGYLATVASTGQAATTNEPCPASAPVKVFAVSAIDVKMWLNRFGDNDPHAQMYVLSSMIGAVRDQEAAGPGSLSIGLADDPLQPLAIRANEGDCVVINFTNATTGPVAWSTSNAYGMHIDGLSFTTNSSGDAIGNNPPSFAAAGITTTYTYYIPVDKTLEGAHYIHPGPGNRQAVAHGLFGTLNVEPPGSTYLNPTTGQSQISGWEAVIVPGTGKAFRENVKVFHEIGNESERNVPLDFSGMPLPTIDPHTGAYRPGSRAINYRSESFMDRLNFADDQKSVVYGSYTFGDTTNIIPRGYLGDPTKFRLVHGGSEVFHVYHLHGGSDRWRFNPMADPTFDYSQTGLDKHPVEVQSESARLDSQSMGPGESFDLEIENGAGGAQQGAGEFLFHCHIAHHYFSGMWGYWRVYDTLQPDLQPLPDRTPLLAAVDSSALIGKTINGQTITADNLDAWIRPQLPTQGVTHDINIETRDTADQDASVWDWAVDTSTGKPIYVGEPDRTSNVALNGQTQLWPDYANAVPGHPAALMIDQPTTSTYLIGGQPVPFNSGGYIGAGDRPKLLFNPDNGRPAFPLPRPHIGKRPPFAPNGHSGAPYLGEYGGQAPSPVLPVGTTSTAPADPWANRPDGICPSGAPLRKYNIVGIAVPIQITNPGKSNAIDPLGALDVLAQDKDGIYAGTKVYAGLASREPLAIRGNIGDCLAITYTSELKDGGEEVPFSKTNIHIHHVQFDTQASDGVITGFSYEQSIRPYKIVDPQLTAALNPGDTTLTLSSVAKFQPGVWIAIGMGTEDIEIRQIVSIDVLNSQLTLSQAVNNAHPVNEWAGTEFVQYRWYPDVELDNIFFHDHVNGIHGWSHGMVGQLIIEPAGSRYFDPVSGAEIRAGAAADIHTDPACVAIDDGMTNGCALIPGVVRGAYREFAVWTINDHEGVAAPNQPAPPEATLNLRAEPWTDRPCLDRAQRFSTSCGGDPFTPILKAYTGDDVVIRNINVGQGTNTLSIDGHRTFAEPRFRDALGVTSSPIDTVHSTVSEKFTLILDGGAGGPHHVAGDFIYHDGEDRRFRDGAWGILRVLGNLDPDNLKPLPDATIPAQTATCPAGAPQHNVAISAVDVAGSGGEGQRSPAAAFVQESRAAAVANGLLFPEPLVLHVAQGECVNVTLHNQRAFVSASFHVGGLLRDMNSAGINVGGNPNTMVLPGASRTFTYYADNVRLESTMISDFGADRGGEEGLYGAVVVAPAGATFSDPVSGAAVDVGAQVEVHAPNTASYRDFTTILADHDPSIGQNTMPYPADVTGPSLINYRQVAPRVDDANMFSSLVHGDPSTPTLRAYAGDPVKVHVLGAPGSEQLHVFNLGGMSWAGDMYIPDSSKWQSRAVGPWEKMDLSISGGAGGDGQQPGDYFYGDLRRPFTQAGMWGLFRVLPNTCASGGVFMLKCLDQVAIPTPTPTATPNPVDRDDDDDGYTNLDELAMVPPESPAAFCEIMRGDVVRDGFVNIIDIAAVGSEFGHAVTPATARRDQGPTPRDGSINIIDIALMGAYFTQPVTDCSGP
jgi:FtsP/CotA-like multicopper oxidase with cupredoxin domain